ncbi:MAG: hypothetical protein GXO79_00255 [Chlorobi bacterium]|nr:hypothetical protein [Chlorobiota bacterium]
MDSKISFIARNTLLTIFFVTLFNIKSNCQSAETGTPFIQNIPPMEYNYENQNFSIAQDTRGIIYVGSLNGVLEYDGHFWNLIEVEGEIRLTASPEGIIYIGAYDDFGYLAPGKSNKLEFQSLLSTLDKSEKPFGQIKSVISSNGNVLFTSDKNIYLWNGQNTQVISSTYTFFKSFKVNNKIYVYKNLDGLYTFRSNALELVENGDFFVDKEIVNILPLESGLLIKTKEYDSPFLFSNEGIDEFQTDADDFFKINGFTSGIYLSNKNYAIGTDRCGIIFINKFGKVINHINKSNGLLDDKINNIFVDNFSQIWVAMSNGISRLEYPSTFSYFDYSAGIRGTISSITRFQKNLYVGTSQGLYFLNNNYNLQKDCSSPAVFKSIEQINAACQYLYPFENKLLIASNNGLFELKNNTVKKLLDGEFNYIINSTSNPSIFYLGKKTGLSALQFFDNKWIDLGDLQKLNKEIRSVYETENGLLWLGSKHDGIFRLNISNGYDIYSHVDQYKEGHGYENPIDWVDIYSTTKGPVFSTKYGLYQFNENKQVFFADSLLGAQYAGGNHAIYKLVENKNGEIWFSSGTHGKYDNLTGIAHYDSTNKPVISTLEFNRIRNYKIEAIYPEDKICWFGSYNGLIRYDKSIVQNNKIKQETYIRKVIIAKDSVLYYGINTVFKKNKNSSALPEINNKYNSIRFEYASPNYDRSEILYQYTLKGYDKNWSAWSASNFKEYTNLRRGKYIFKVRAKNKYGQITQEATFTFKVLPSLFSSTLAFIYYLIVAISFFYMITKLRSYRFAKERYELEQIINIRTEELAYEKEKADELFAKATSEDSLSELIMREKDESKRFKNVSVLLVELSGFDNSKEKENKDAFNKIFKYFDVIIERNQLQKIKSETNTYVCCGGLPEASQISALNSVLAAREMIDHINKINNDNSIARHTIFIQIGIHTGPVAAMYSGKKKIPYNLSGETVNIANRVLASSEIGKISISSKTYKYVKNFFVFQFVEKLQVKFIGNIDRFIIDGLNPLLSIDGKGFEPNDEFKTQVALMRFYDLKNYVLRKIENELPKNQYFHNVKHAINFISHIDFIAHAEKVNSSELLLLETAALFYDLGFIKSYSDHEVKSLKFAKEILPQYGYNNEQIKQISDLLYAIKKNPTPKNKLEMIICDAYFDHLGSNEFNKLSRNLFKELVENKKFEDDFDKWNTEQLNFLENHVYFTETAKNFRNSYKQKTIDHLKKRSTNH